MRRAPWWTQNDVRLSASPALAAALADPAECQGGAATSLCP
ncbi:hypothetical protein RQM47_01905 [Rubrivirga sp. S365]|uniref:Uncharacterized protein n=1 Tax=Rubrivirga litoralis TaxID=3075598 RepID=A0ABU3BPA8_9BACT|nr:MULTISPECIES: hypothetical protein [unclassified Rubrivirga]MDT0631098.1 hypothetical protein [Rubrivirga sp. F394]MDT7855389.1 hypothetical protein [Rubrivirga sp. S365]